ncbi:hypothetical protein SAMN05428963_11431 [Consotaella salsifontis]|uniref:Uncharacterized protein n=2 Tax=Consotaella salsifontis TaxID=1365950 RepID=A0A1T4STU4_9HYPH|nr:hypothetical protein SAMN05428963_11431 [Consotaella salsifontis]
MTASALSANAQVSDSKNTEPSGQSPFWFTDTISDAAATLLKWNASLRDRPKSGPCKGERVEKPEHCSVVITASVLKNEGSAAAAAIIARVSERPKAEIRAWIVHRGILEKMAEKGGRLDEALITNFTENLANAIKDKSCSESIRLSEVEYWLQVGDEANAKNYLRTISPEKSHQTDSLCPYAGKLDSYRYALLDYPASSGEISFIDVTTAIIYTGKMPLPKVRYKLADLAISVAAASGIEEPIPLLIAVARDIENTDLERWLAAKSQSR